MNPNPQTSTCTLTSGENLMVTDLELFPGTCCRSPLMTVNAGLSHVNVKSMASAKTLRKETSLWPPGGTLNGPCFVIEVGGCRDVGEIQRQEAKKMRSVSCRSKIELFAVLRSLLPFFLPPHGWPRSNATNQGIRLFVISPITARGGGTKTRIYC